MVALAAAAGTPFGAARAQERGIDQIENVVVIFAENRSFDNLYGHFPGADGIDQASPESVTQKDRDGTPLAELPPVWDGLTAKGFTPPVTQAETEHLANAVFAVDDPNGFNQPLTTITHDLWHRYYQNMMQIDGGKNDKFVAWADSGAMPMGVWDGSKTAMWDVAKKYTLADHFFMGAFGGSFFNHQWLICACAPHYADADTSAAKPTIAKVDPDGVTLTIADNSPKSAMEGIPKFVSDGNLTPDFYAVNTMQPPYQPSANPPAEGGDPAYADPMKATTMPPQTQPTIGDMLSLGGVSWAWYGGAWQYTLDNGNNSPVPNFQYHHQPLNYYASFAPGTAARAEHLRDGGLNGTSFLQVVELGQAAAGRLLQAAGQPQRALGLRRHRGRRQAHRRRRQPSREEPAVGAHARRRDLRRERRHLGPRGAAEGRPLGAGLAHPGDHHLALCEDGHRRPHALRHDVDPALHHRALRAAGAARHRGA